MGERQTVSDVVNNKAASIRLCVKRAREDHAAADDFASDFTRQDAAILNVLRACEQSVDLANHITRTRKLGIPSHSRDAFRLLAREGLLPLPLSERLQRLIGFRNTAVHAYQALEIPLVEEVIDKGLEDLLAFANFMLKAAKE